MAKPLSCWFFSEKKTRKEVFALFLDMKRRRMLKLTLTENKSIQIANIIADFQWISMSFRTHPCVLAFITHVLFKTEFSWLFSGEFDIHLLIYFSNSQFSSLRWWILVNMPFKETLYGDRVGDGAVAMLLRLWQHATVSWRHAVWMCIVTSQNTWMGNAYWLPNLNHPRAIHK